MIIFALFQFVKKLFQYFFCSFGPCGKLFSAAAKTTTAFRWVRSQAKSCEK